MTAGVAVKARRRLSADDLVLRAGIVAVLAALILFVALPLWALLSKSFQNADGGFVGFANYVRYFATPSLLQPLWNSLAVASISTALVLPAAFLYAYALTRSCMPAKGLFRALALIPILAPSLLPALSLVYIFGNQGFLKSWLFGNEIYGAPGIVMAQVFYCFPHALTVLVAALSLADARLYEAASALGASRLRTFTTVTLPGAKYGVIGAGFVVFTLVITDFGIAKVIGGRFEVMATDVYKQVVGQQNFEMGAVVGMMLLVPAVLAFVADRIVARRQVALLTARAVPYAPKPRTARDLPLFVFCCAVAGIMLFILGMAVWASFITYWPYNLKLTLRNYGFDEFDPAGWSPFLNSLLMSGLVAGIGTAFVFFGAYTIEKAPGARPLRMAAHFLAMLPLAVPGLVIGLGYVFFFNARWNPMGFLYGTLAILVLNTLAHFYTVAHLTATTALKQIDPEFESVSASLKVPVLRTFARVTVPVSMPAILDIGVYLFVNAMTTVSAVIFLYGSDTKLAAIAIVNMDEAGFTAAAAAMSTLIVLVSAGVKGLQILLSRAIDHRTMAWRSR